MDKLSDDTVKKLRAVHLNSVRNVMNRTTSLPGANTLGRYNVGNVESWAIKRSTTPGTSI